MNVIIAIDIVLENIRNEKSVHVPTDTALVKTPCYLAIRALMFNQLEQTKV